MVQSLLPAAVLQVSASDNAHAFIGSPSFNKKKLRIGLIHQLFFL